MKKKPPHIDWLVDTKNRLKTLDGRTVEIWEFQHVNDNAVLSEWAKHFRNFYCNDNEIDVLRNGTCLSRANYLLDIIFPDSFVAPGPSIRAGDFAEILVADFLSFILDYWVPCFRYDEKTVRNESTKGADILGFKFLSEKESVRDILAIYEVKAKLTGKPENRLQNAVDDSAKDFMIRKSFALNALKRRLIRSGNKDDALKVERFQDQVARPYKEISGAAVLFSKSLFNSALITNTTTSNHPNGSNLSLILIHGNDLMPLVHSLYVRAANEA